MAHSAVKVEAGDERFRDGLTTTYAPFIEQAIANGELYIQQPYELYSAENHDSSDQAR